MAPPSTRRRRPPRPPGALYDLPPLSILRRIVILQTAYYLLATILIIFTALVFGRPVSLGLVLDWRTIRGDTTVGVMMGGIWLGVGFLSVIPLLVLLPRSRLIPDFALTIHFFHLLAVSIYTRSVPTNLLWWGLQCCSSVLMIVLGMWAGRYREMRPISFGGSGTQDKDKKNIDLEAGPGDEERGFLRGGRGRGRDRTGESGYEMVEREAGRSDMVSPAGGGGLDSRTKE